MKSLNRVITLFLVLSFLACEEKETPDFTSIEGLWKCQEIDEFAKVHTFSVDIEQVYNYPNAYIISNFHNLGEENFARVSVKDSLLIISEQAITNNIFSGEGIISIDFKKIDAEYIIETDRRQTYLVTFFR